MEGAADQALPLQQSTAISRPAKAGSRLGAAGADGIARAAGRDVEILPQAILMP